MSEKAIAYLKENQEVLLKKLYEFLAIPSVSTDPAHKKDVHRAADFLTGYLNELGFESVEKMETKGHPLVYAEYTAAGPEAPTVLLYGHYDVQPVDPIDLWDSEPFQAEVRDGRIYARGSSDDKGQTFMHLAVFEAFLKTEGKLPMNVKVCIEGEEEIGSENLYELLHEKKDQFQADFAVISDSGMAEKNQPTILYGLKGFTGVEITLTGPDHDLHSGMYGGAVRNPLMAMSHLLASMKDEEEVITVDGFYDNVEDLTPDERELMEKAPGEDFVKATNIPETVSEKGYTAKEHTMGRPTLEVNGLFGGYQGEGTKTIIPSTATAKITCRLVPGQDPQDIQEKLVDHIHKNAPSGVHVHVEKEKLSAKAYKVEPDHPLIKKAAKSYTKAFGKETVFLRMGGSIPVVEWLEAAYQYPIVLLGFGTPEDRLHSPNESFPVDSFEKGMETLAYYWSEL
ncbi:dipeptidase [Oceanobacillus sojae]|uniref:dipeptidase n=1 Tax=Oceanobacillus sojae TaxID=582851 RepID=UPI00098893CE|nr:dipeptidase [Oceanobacillus sojae]MCT1903162.1 dipeptidase [Oceanobacillus sojae]